jgi:hypothetical protein
MPVDQAWILNMVFDADAERFADFGGNSETSVRLPNAKYRGSFAVHLEGSAFEAQYRGRLTCRLGACEGCSTGGKGETNNAAARKQGARPTLGC